MTNIDKTMTTPNEPGKEPTQIPGEEPKTPEVKEPTGEEPKTPDVADLQKQIATLTAQKEHWKTKANTIAEPEPTEPPAPEEPKTPETNTETPALTPVEMMAIMEAKVPSADLPELQTLAKAKGMTLDQALADDTVKIVLERRAEERSIAAAQDTGKGKAPKAETSASDLLSSAHKTGAIPESEDDIAKLVLAQKGITE